MAAATAKKQDLNTIPYDAPLSFKEPGFYWTRVMARRGANAKYLTKQSVPDADLTGKWVIISGGNNGIGREAALQFATWGANIVLACRDPPPHETKPEAVVKECLERATRAGYTIQAESWEVDMTKIATIDAFTQRWLDTGRPLDILCNNAGVGSSPGGDQVFKTGDGFEFVHQINFLSHVLMTLRLLPSLKKAKEPRVVCTTSCFHYFGSYDLRGFNGEIPGNVFTPVKFYMNNKLWFQCWLTELQHRLLQHDDLKHITVNGIHPGYVNTGIWAFNFKAPFQELVGKLMAYFIAINPQQGSLAITNCATCPEGGPNLRLQGVGTDKGLGGGGYFNRIWPETPMPHAQDRDARLRVWRLVAEELELKDKGLLDQLGVEANDL